MAPHTWSHLGDTVSDATHRMYYRGQRIKEAYYRGEKIWGEERAPIIGKFLVGYYSSMYANIVGEDLYYVVTDITGTISTKRMPIESGVTTLLSPNAASYYSLPPSPHNKLRNPVVAIHGRNITHMSFDCSSYEYLSRTPTMPYVVDYGDYSLKQGGTGILEVLAPFSEECSNVTDISNLFRNNRSLCSVPEDLFCNMPNVTNAASAFQCCICLKNIPEKIFSYMPNIENFDFTFAMLDIEISHETSRMTSLTKYMYGLDVYDYESHSVNIQSIINNPFLLTDIPENIFKYNTKVRSFDLTFLACLSIRTIPENIFAHKQEVISFDGTFMECRSLEEIPQRLFINNPKVKSFRGTFCGCESLEWIPRCLFAGNPEVETFGTLMTYDNRPLYRPVIEIYPEHYMAGVLANCTRLGNPFTDENGIKTSHDIPDDLFAYSENITDLSGAFSKSGIYKIPRYLLTNSPSASSFMFLPLMFYECENLIGSDSEENSLIIPSGIFFSRMFEQCVNLQWQVHLPIAPPNAIEVFRQYIAEHPTRLNYGYTELSPYVSIKNPFPYRYTYLDCKSIKGRAQNLWDFIPDSDWGIACFQGCTSLENYDKIPYPWKWD